MRSSIACARCRRSKVKCINAGIGTTCRACESSGRECTYPPPVLVGGGGGAKRDSTDAGEGEREVKRHRPKKSGTSVPVGGMEMRVGARHSTRALIDALDPALLTPKTWQEVFDIFQLHFSTDLPFFHPRTFLAPLRRAVMPLPGHTTSFLEPQPPSPAAPASPLLLLALLALTARFHPALAAYHSPATASQSTNPLVASEYYASAVRARLAGPNGEALARPSVERIQALLMLGLHEWGMCRGIQAWLFVGIAVRTSQAMGLEFEQDLDDEPLAISSAMCTEAEHLGVTPGRRGSKERAAGLSQSFVDQEIRRRTFWSCFIMDRYLSSGKYRPQMITVRDLRIQLPSSDRAFLFSERVRTTLLGEDVGAVTGRVEIQGQRRTGTLHSKETGDVSGDNPYGLKHNLPFGSSSSAIEEYEEKGRWEVGVDEGVLSRVVKIVEIWGRIAKWSCAGGRRTEDHPPWRLESTFASLRDLLASFYKDLPHQLRFSIPNVEAHIASKSSTPYTVMHTIYFLCLIVLHREYVPFIPIRCSKPQGPLDPPTFPPENYDIPPGFWDESARELFKAARDMMDLVRTCQEWNALVETPMVGFAIYTVAFVGVYAFYFPQMDPNAYMCTPSAALTSAADPVSSGGQLEARRAIQIMGHMRARLKMAEGWFGTIQLMHRYYDKLIQDYKRNTQALVHSSESEIEGRPRLHRHLSLREGGLGGGLEEYKLLEKTLKEFGVLEDENSGEEDAKMVGTSPDATEVAEAGSAAVKDEGAESSAGNVAPRRDGWAAVNTVVHTLVSSQTPELVALANASSVQSPYAPSRPPLLGDHQAPGPQYQYSPSQQQPNQNASTTSPNPPSLLSPGSHTASTPSLASPYPGSEYFNQRQQQPQTSYQPTYPHHPSPVYSLIQQPHQQPPLPHQSPLNSHLASASNTIRPEIATSNPAGFWNPEAKETWLNSLHTRLGGDDVAAFVDGSSWEDWASMAGSSAGRVGGWLSTVWSAATRDAGM
ncbi:MAG: hypothetical protein M1830_003487 [Pleopsidium flavum]|nr:MAG: hypothetical protein M1830_003487 [Pleopsidium flavum]